jgi:LmbE family N-acetylglucosaminyl deacetylase
MKYFLLILSLFYSFGAHSQQVRPSTSADIYKEINTLKKLPRVLYLAAHPDDENTGLLSWLVNQQHINTAYLSLTRGDGGQNLIGSEQGPALGLIRTYELLEARKVDGAKQFFSTAIDFGFSKNPDDTFKQWDIDKITADVVWVIRNFRPDIIITRFPPSAAAGHGQHWSSAIIAEEAFKAAADNSRYPEQLKKVDVWQAKRLVGNTFRFGSENTTSEEQFKVTIGQYDPGLGMGYGELAGLSRSMHQSQGAGTASVAGIRTEYFTPVLGDPIQTSLFDGINLSWTDIQKPEIDNALDKLISQYDFRKPDQSLEQLLALRKLVRSIDDKNLKEEKLIALDAIILSASGLMAEMVTRVPEAVAGDTLTFQLNVISRSEIPVLIQKVQYPLHEEQLNKKLFPDSLTNFNYEVRIPESSEISEPYWLKNPLKSEAQYDVQIDSLIGLSLAPSPLNAILTLLIGDETFNVNVPFSYKKLDPIKGDLVEPLRIIPAVNIKFSQPLFFQDSDANVEVILHSEKEIRNASLTIKSENQILSTLNNIHLKANSDTTIQIQINPNGINRSASANPSLEAALQVENKSYTKDKHIIRYNHIPVLQYFTPANTLLVNADLQVKAKKVGYIQGAGDIIPDFLRMVGIEVTILQESDFANVNKLTGFDAIVAGIRVINVEKRMPQWMPVLNQYIQNGGTVIMQFNTLQDMSTTNIGPYPFTIGRNRVTEENAPVEFLAPASPLLNTPNKITQDDFQGWIQERGLYFLNTWDKNYTPLFKMNDTGEEPLEGGTIYAQYGKGYFIYTPLAFFRQLTIGNKGATKLFFNMLSIGK